MSDFRIGSRPTSTAWILSPTLDLLFLVGTPVLIVPAIWIIGRRWATPEQIDLVVASFASFAHHLPGFYRCYGDAELFARFRWRFLLAPPLFLTVSALFLFQDLHGLTLVLLLWGTWHGMMQTYGFMRIYDVKGGRQERWSKYLDFSVCFAIFAAGMLYSDARVNAVITGLWQSGISPLDASWLPRLRGLCTVLVGLVALCYGINAILSFRRGHINSPKLLLAIMTGGLYLLAGTATTNVLVGIAMFEVFHAAQYYAVVWTYNRRLADAWRGSLGAMATQLLRPRPLLAIYVASIAGFGCVRYFGSALTEPVTQKCLLSLIATSTLLHFYFDGFIWKVRERSIPENTSVKTAPVRQQRQVLPLEHLAKCGLLAIVLCSLFALERRHDKNSAAHEDQLLKVIYQWTPNLPEVQALASQSAIRRGNVAVAVELAQKAVARRPRSYRAQATLGRAHRAAGQHSDAVTALKTAVQLAPGDWRCYHDLTDALLADGQFQTAREVALSGLDISRNSALLLSLGSALCALNEFDEALEVLGEAAASSTHAAIANYRLGLVYLENKNVEKAVQCLEIAVDRDPSHLQSRFQLGLSYYQTGRLASAARQFERCLQNHAPFPELLNNLGAVYFALERWDEAITTYRRALDLAPENAAAHYNLALAYYELSQFADARRHLEEARRLGQPIPPQLLLELNQGR
ncbi:MAG: tetratricopeptide repeat protein [Planctomycetota bacterium]|nr:tetratricopeptide repeat protein [Planctomycetota bacterium]